MTVPKLNDLMQASSLGWAWSIFGSLFYSQVYHFSEANHGVIQVALQNTHLYKGVCNDTGYRALNLHALSGEAPLPESCAVSILTSNRFGTQDLRTMSGSKVPREIDPPFFSEKPAS